MSDKWIILDLGNVCINVDPFTFPRALGLSLQNVGAEVWELQKNFECGKVSEDEFFTFGVEYLQGKFSVGELKKAYCEIIQDEIPGMADFVRERKAEGYKFCMLSDTSEIHLKDAAKKLSFFDEFDEFVLSYEVGYQKPHSAMYEAVEKIIGGKPVCFTDDKAINIEGAEKCGWAAFLYEGPQKFFEDFEGL